MVITNSGLWADLIVPCELHSPTPATVDWVDTQPALDQGASSQGIGKQAWRIPVLVWIVFKERRCKFENYVSLWNREWRKQMCRKGEKKKMIQGGVQRRVEGSGEKRWKERPECSGALISVGPEARPHLCPRVLQGPTLTRMCSPSNESPSFGLK